MVSIFKFEFRRNIKKIGIIILCSIIFGLLINQTAINKYKNIARDEFINVETIKVDCYYSIQQYNIVGFKTMFFPAPVSSLFNYSTILNDLQAKVTTSYHLDLKSDGRREIGNLDFSWFLPLLSSIFSFLFGFFAFRNIEQNQKYLKVLLSLSNLKNVYFNIVLCRVLLIILSLAVLFFVVYLQFFFNGLATNGLLPFFLVSNLIALFFLGLGFIIGPSKSFQKGAVTAALIWFIIFLLWPNLLNLQLSEKAKMKSIYQNEAKKIEIIIKGENQVIENLRKGKDRTEVIREYITNFLKDREIEKLEIDMLEGIKKKARSFHFWSIFNPVTFYQSVNNELSSKGYNGYCEFYKFNIQKKEGFIKFYLDRLESGKVEPYLSGNEYLFYSKPSLPAFFIAGVLLHFFYILAFITIGYYRVKKLLFPKEKNEVLSDLAIKLPKGKHYSYTFLEKAKTFPEQVFNVLMGRPGNFSGKIFIDDKNIVTGEKKNFVYLPFPDMLPGDIKVKSLIKLFAGLFKIKKTDVEKVKGEFEDIIKERFENIEDVDKVNLLLRLAAFKKADIYLFRDFMKNIKDKPTLHKIIDDLKKEGILIFEINRDVLGYLKYDRLTNIVMSDKPNYNKYEEDRLG